MVEIHAHNQKSCTTECNISIRLKRSYFSPTLPSIILIGRGFSVEFETRAPTRNALLIAPRSQQHELGSSIRQAFNWSQRWDLPLNASKSHHLSIGGTPDLRIALPEEAAGKSLQKCELINDLGITVNAAFTPSANVLAATNKARGMLYFIKRSFTCLTKEIFSYLYTVLWCNLISNTPSEQIVHTSKRILTT